MRVNNFCGVCGQMQIRLSVPEDLPALTEIYNEQVLNGVATFDTEPKCLAERRIWFDSHQHPRYPLVSAVLEGKIAGWGSLSPFHTRPAYNPTAEFSVYVHTDFRGCGVGSLILGDLLQRARRAEFHSVIGLISGSNTASLAMAAKFDFRQVGRYHEVGRKFGQYLDVVSVQLML